MRRALKTSSRGIHLGAVLATVVVIAAGIVFFESARTVSSQRRVAAPSGSLADQIRSKAAADVLAATANGGTPSVVVFLSEQADLSRAYSMKDQDARGWFVYNTLKDVAERTQAPIKDLLETDGVKYESFWAANMLVLDADQSLVEKLAARSDIARIDVNKPTRWIEDPVIANKVDANRKDTPATVEWGVSNVNAPSIWAMGFTGQGIVVGDLDTGTRWTHAALKGHYRGWNGATANHNFNWHDAVHSGGGSCGANTVAPCDDSGHGTHTAGSMVGDDGSGNQIGVAPGAKWIGCRNMDQGNGTPATYTECFQFMIAPTDLTGANPNPALRPHVLNNSWTCPTSEGCATKAELETIVNNTQAAGIFVEASAGNSGPACSTVSDPPAIYSASFSTGAIDINNSLAGFSSRGPSTFYTPNILKPNISAPGVGVRSSYSTTDTTFANLSGTSMAGPHVVGVVALLWSARPQLSRDIAATKNVLQNTANPGVTVALETCGGIASTAIPNNSFGYGRVDALAAVNSVPVITTAAAVSISGRVLGREGGGIRGVAVTITEVNGGRTTVLTNAFGYYHFDTVPSGKTYVVQAAARRLSFAPRTINLTDQLSNLDFVDGR
ncbi:MAG: S8 family serine peptidase [Pyrinomonadaceae bacterium]